MPNADGTMEYQYHLTDHLGNVRVTFTTQQHVDEYTASLEAQDARQEAADFPGYAGLTLSQASAFNHTATPGATSSMVLNGAPSKQVGLAKSIRVMPGDVIDIAAYAKYFRPSSGSAVGTLIAQAVTQAFGLGAASTGVDAHAYQSLNGMFANGWVLGPDDVENTDAPKAYLNYILFDDSFIPYGMGWDQVDGAADATHMPLGLQATARKPGYVYIYMSNEDQQTVEVYFDDLVITHTHSPLIQTDDYYPYGLSLAHATRPDKVQNQFLFNGGSELNAITGLYETPNRAYDATLGRFTQIDALAASTPMFGSYSFAFSNPVIFNDPMGLAADKPKPMENEGQPGPVRGSGGINWNLSRQGSGEHWADGIGYDDWSSQGGSDTYRNFLGAYKAGADIYEFGGRWYGTDAEGNAVKLNSYGGLIGYASQDVSIENGVVTVTAGVKFVDMKVNSAATQQREPIIVHVTDEIVGYTTAKSYKYRTADDGGVVLYQVPLYKVVVTGEDDAGKRVMRTFQAVRFGVQRNSTGGSFMVGITEGAFNLSPSTYKGTSYHIDGGMANDGAYIHAGNANISFAPNSYVGCVGISGPSAFTKFINTMNELGFGSVGATAIFQAAPVPALVDSGLRWNP